MTDVQLHVFPERPVCVCVCVCASVSQLHHRRLCSCQGMNFIAGYLVIITKDEEKSFWLMDALLGRMLPGSFFYFLSF